MDEQHKEMFTGNILLFYIFDVGDDVDLELIKHKGLLQPCVVPLSSYFKNYHLPLSFRLQDQRDELQDYARHSYMQIGGWGDFIQGSYDNYIGQINNDIGDAGAVFVSVNKECKIVANVDMH